MFGFFNRKPRQPDWSTFMSADEYADCVKLLDEHLRSLPIPTFSIVDGVVVFEGDDRKMGLQNLLQTCHRAGREHWLEIIRDHFAAMDEAREQYDLTDFGAIQPRLTVRIYSEESMEQIKDNLLYRRHIPGTASVLCVDMPKSIRTVSRTEIGHWPMNYDELFAVAMDNTARLSKAQQDTIELDAETSLQVIVSEDTYAATAALQLEKFPELIGDHGSLVAIPTAGIVLVYPFNDASVVSAVHKMIAIADTQYDQGPQSVSNRLYWRQHGGTFVDLPWRIDGRDMIFTPPGEFIDLLNRLGSAS